MMHRSTPNNNTISNRFMWPWALLAITVAMIASWPASADHDQIVRVRFLGWSSTSPDTYLLYIIDEDRGNRLEIREVGKPTSVLSVSAPESSARSLLESEQFANWSFDYETYRKNQGLDAPNGWRLSGSVEGSFINIQLSNGKGSIVLGSARLKPTGAATYAGAEISDAFWSSDSSRVVVLVTHTKAGSWGLDVDEAYGFKLTSSGGAEDKASAGKGSEKAKSAKN
ncbi:MAG: hypothetical protein AAFS10_07655 [Myxococcota bacterium]